MNIDPLFITKLRLLLEEKGIKRISLIEQGEKCYRLKAVYLEWGVLISIVLSVAGIIAVLHSETFLVGIFLLSIAIYTFLKNLPYFNSIILDFGKNQLTVVNRDLLVWILISRQATIPFKDIQTIQMGNNYGRHGLSDYEIEIQTKNEEKYILMKFHKKSSAEAFNELFELLKKN